jgi:hypothetical protein
MSGLFLSSVCAFLVLSGVKMNVKTRSQFIGYAASCDCGNNTFVTGYQGFKFGIFSTFFFASLRDVKDVLGKYGDERKGQRA